MCTVCVFFSFKFLVEDHILMDLKDTWVFVLSGCLIINMHTNMQRRLRARIRGMKKAFLGAEYFKNSSETVWDMLLATRQVLFP